MLRERHSKRITLASIILNIFLIIYKTFFQKNPIVLIENVPLRKEQHQQKQQQSVECLWNDPVGRSKSLSMKLRSAKLTHMVISFHPSQEATLLRNLELWRHFAPCDNTNNDIFGRDVSLTFFVSSDADPVLETRILSLFQSLPQTIMGCFSQVKFHTSRFRDDDGDALRSSRAMFEQMLNGWLGMVQPAYVLYMTPDTIPIRSAWLATIDTLTRYPSAPFWIKGSPFRGDTAQLGVNCTLVDRMHIDATAIYNLGDPSFRHFYFDLVRPYVAKKEGEAGFAKDIGSYILDDKNDQFYRSNGHLFQYTDAIQNYWHTTYYMKEIRDASNLTVLIHGGLPRS